MSEFFTGFVTSALICTLGFVLEKICIMSKEQVIEPEEPEYIVMNRSQYDYMKNNPDVKKIIIEQPQLPSLYNDDLIVMKTPPPPLIKLDKS
jgi:hypothetical protein